MLGTLARTSLFEVRGFNRHRRTQKKRGTVPSAAHKTRSEDLAFEVCGFYEMPSQAARRGLSPFFPIGSGDGD